MSLDEIYTFGVGYMSHLVLILVLVAYFHAKQRGIKLFFIIFLATLISYLAELNALKYNLNMAISTCIFLIILIGFCYLNLRNKLLNHIVIVASELVVYLGSIRIGQYILELVKTNMFLLKCVEFNYDTNERLLINEVFVVFSLIIIKIRNNHTVKLEKVEWRFAVINLCLSMTIILVIEIFVYPNVEGLAERAYLTLISVAVIFMDLLLYGMIVRLSHDHTEKIKYQMLEKQKEQQEILINEMIASGNKIRKIKHDMNIHISILSNLLSNKQTEEAEKYLTQLEVYKEKEYDHYISTNSLTVTTLINYKIRECKRDSIMWKLEVSAEFPLDKDLDICLIIGNLLNNAIEASKKIDEANRLIVFQVFEQGNYLAMIVKNRIMESVLEKNPMLNSTKGTKEIHGFGIQSVRDVVEKYDGMMSVTEEKAEQGLIFVVKTLVML